MELTIFEETFMEKDKILSLIDSLSKQDIEYDSIIEYIESILI